MKRSLLTLMVLGLCLAAFGCVESQLPTMDAGSGVAAQTDTGSAEAVTYRNDARNFSYTIPKGWVLNSGDPKGDNASFSKADMSLHFSFHYTAMTDDFPAETSVRESMKQDKQYMEKTQKYILVERKDDSAKDDGAGAIGWLHTESATGGGGDHQRIQWQCYDMENWYFNFTANSHPDVFQANEAELMGIIQSIKFSK